MRVLLLFRGAPGCGKSTYINENGYDIISLRKAFLSSQEGTQ